MFRNLKQSVSIFNSLACEKFKKMYVISVVFPVVGPTLPAIPAAAGGGPGM